MKSPSLRRSFYLTLLVVLMMGVFVMSARAQARSFDWAETTSLNHRFHNHTTTLLPDGRVLVAGGEISRGSYDRSSAQAQIYDPATASWTRIADMTQARFHHVAVSLADGRVLLISGSPTEGSNPSKTAEIYDPATETFSATGSLSTGRSGFTATLLTDGRVLVAGGGDGLGHDVPVAEIYDPMTGQWALTGTLHEGRFNHGAVLLRDGKVLVAGGGTFAAGFVVATCELYDPATGAWSYTGSLPEPRLAFSATVLADGRVLAAGGSILDSPFATAECDLYDPGTGTWSPTGSLMGTRDNHRAVSISQGKVLVVGGRHIEEGSPYDRVVLTPRTEVYNPATGTWSKTGRLLLGRLNFTATRLDDDSVLVAGGLAPDGPTQEVELGTLVP